MGWADLDAKEYIEQPKSVNTILKPNGHLEISACNENSTNGLRFCDGGAAF